MPRLRCSRSTRVQILIGAAGSGKKTVPIHPRRSCSRALPADRSPLRRASCAQTSARPSSPVSTGSQRGERKMGRGVFTHRSGKSMPLRLVPAACRTSSRGPTLSLRLRAKGPAQILPTIALTFWTSHLTVCAALLRLFRSHTSSPIHPFSSSVPSYTSQHSLTVSFFLAF